MCSHTCVPRGNSGFQLSRIIVHPILRSGSTSITEKRLQTNKWGYITSKRVLLASVIVQNPFGYIKIRFFDDPDTPLFYAMVSLQQVMILTSNSELGSESHNIKHTSLITFINEYSLSLHPEHSCCVLRIPNKDIDSISDFSERFALVLLFHE